MIAVDTNVLIYAHDPRDSRKQDTAISILNSVIDGVLLRHSQAAVIRCAQECPLALRHSWATDEKGSSGLSIS